MNDSEELSVHVVGIDDSDTTIITLPKTGCQDPGLEAWVQRLRLSRAEDLDCLGSKLGSNPSILCVTLCKFLDGSEI